MRSVLGRERCRLFLEEFFLRLGCFRERFLASEHANMAAAVTLVPVSEVLREFSELDRQEKIGRITVNVDHDTAKQDQLALRVHPLTVHDLFDLLLDNGVSVQGEFGHLGILGLLILNLRHVLLECIFDEVHLLVFDCGGSIFMAGS